MSCHVIVTISSVDGEVTVSSRCQTEHGSDAIPCGGLSVTMYTLDHLRDNVILIRVCMSATATGPVLKPATVKKSILADRTYLKYFKMLTQGIPFRVVREEMTIASIPTQPLEYDITQSRALLVAPWLSIRSYCDVHAMPTIYLIVASPSSNYARPSSIWKAPNSDA